MGLNSQHALVSVVSLCIAAYKPATARYNEAERLKRGRKTNMAGIGTLAARIMGRFNGGVGFNILLGVDSQRGAPPNRQKRITLPVRRMALAAASASPVS